MVEPFHFAIRMDAFHAILDLGGTFVFALSGGVMRDILIAEVPVVLRADFYAVAALAGAAVVVIGQMLGVSSAAAMTVGALLCFGLRFMAIRYRWGLPVAIGGRRQ